MTADWTAALASYARRFHAAAGEAHHVASPLGAWLLLALAGTANGKDKDLTDALGMDPAEAAEIAAALLARPHPLVAAATAVWRGEQVDPGGLADWWATLPEQTGTGPLPGKAELDSWAREHTFGLIDEFPVEPSPEILLVLASALATKVSWSDPFEVAPAAGLGGEWGAQLTHVLRTPDNGHRAYLATTAAAGDVIVHVSSAESADAPRDRLHVLSVAAAGDVEPERVLAAAYELAPVAIRDGRVEARKSLFDLPLGEGPLCTIREEHGIAGREEVTAFLPCWSATSDHDLSAPDLGFPAITGVLAPLVGVEHPSFEAKQAAVASFGRYGFEAAALTTYFMTTSVPAEGPMRRAELRFNHPYAVVAVTSQQLEGETGPWHGVPVFSAWVAEPENVPEADRGPRPGE